MDRSLKRSIGILLTVLLISTGLPSGTVWAAYDAETNAYTEAADSSAASAAVSEEAENTENDTDILNDDTEGAEEAPDVLDDTEDTEAITEDVQEKREIIGDEKNVTDTGEPEAGDAVESEAPSVTVDTEISNGSVELGDCSDGIWSGLALPDANYDLATVRQIWTDENGKERTEYLKYTKTGSGYAFETVDAGCESTVTAYFYDLKRWDGTVDISWYDPDQTEFDLSTPAQLAGLAAITNGMVDENVTAEYMIKDNEGREFSDGKYTHKHISTEPAIVDLLSPNNVEGAIQVRDTAWRLPEVEHKKVGGASDDIHNDFLYRTVRLTADMDMGDVNWTPIGGKYAMNRDAADGVEAKVIDTRFQGVFDGQGHTVTLNCNRQAKLGFAYAMEIALIGYLGGGVDYKNGYPKDTYMDYENYWIPTARNIIVRGKVAGRRMVAGVVGRTGETNHGVIVENCVNYADVSATDMRGCAGIVGAAWGKAVIRNCYNAGTIHSNYWEHGGIVGSNGYEGSEGREPGGADIYNCYNVGETAKYDFGSSSWVYDGQEIGVDGEAFASYKVANCYYEAPETPIENKTGFSTGNTSTNKRARVMDVRAADIRSDEILELLNSNGEVFFRDTENINNGYPVLYFQTAEYQSSPGSFGSADVTLESNDTSMGTVTSPDDLTAVPYGTVINLTANAAKGCRFSHFIINDGETEREAKYGSFVCVTGRDITVTGVFTERSSTKIAFAEEDDGEDYYIRVTKIRDGSNDSECSEIIRDGDALNYNDWIKLEPVMKPLDTVHPDIKNLEYTGKFGDPVYTDNSLEKVANRTGIYSVTGETDVIELSYKPKTQGKRWTTVADTSWYKAGTKVFTITGARQLAGLALLCENGTDFSGVTIKLGNDISLANTKANSGDDYGYERSWIGIGNAAHPFNGTFDGQGHTVKYMHRNFAYGYSNGSNGGLFGVTEGAKIYNVKVEGGAYINDTDVSMDCGFINGANGGGIVGDAIDTLIENCTASVPMYKAFSTGGIAGEAEGSTVIRNCTSNCDISGEGESIGGIVGSLGDGNSTIEKCVNNGTLQTTKWKIGGILGDGKTYQGSITKCINYGDITTEMKGTSSYVHAAGGIAGYAGGALTINECVNRGDITGKLQTYAMGGIAGTVLRATVTNCYNSGRIYSESSSKYAEVSGVLNMGTNKSYIATVMNCYNIGEVVTGESFAGSAVGGAIAYGNTESNVTKNVFCTDAAVININGNAGVAGTVVAAEAFKSYDSQLGNAFIKDASGINNGYPVLTWEDPNYVPPPAVKPVTPVKLLPAKPLKSVKNSKKKSAVIKWSRVSGAAGYEIFRATSAKGTYKKIKTVKVTSKNKKTKTLSYTNKSLKKKKKYYYKLRYYKTVNGKKVYSEMSKAKSVKIKK